MHTLRAVLFLGVFYKYKGVIVRNIILNFFFTLNTNTELLTANSA